MDFALSTAQGIGNVRRGEESGSEMAMDDVAGGLRWRCWQRLFRYRADLPGREATGTKKTGLGRFFCCFQIILRGLEGGIWSERLDSNQRPSRPERDALPSCATLRFVGANSTEKVLVHKGLDEFFFEPGFPGWEKQRPRRSFESTGSSGKPVTRRYQSSLTVRT